MMNAEEDIDLSEEIAAMNLTSSDLATDLALITNSSLSSLSPHSSRHSSKAPSISGDMFTKQNNSLDDNTGKRGSITGSLTPVELEVASGTTPMQKTASDLFGGDSKDIFSSLSSTNSLTGGSANQISSFDIVPSVNTGDSITSFEMQSKGVQDDSYFNTPMQASSSSLFEAVSFPKTAVQDNVSDITNTIQNSFGLESTKSPSDGNISTLSSAYDTPHIASNSHHPYASTTLPVANYTTLHTLTSSHHSLNVFSQNKSQGEQQIITGNNVPNMQNESFKNLQPYNLSPVYSNNFQQPYQQPNQYVNNNSLNQSNPPPMIPSNQSNTGLFIPSMYSSQKETTESKPSFFVPAQPTESTYNTPTYQPPPMLSNNYPTQHVAPDTYGGQLNHNKDMYQVQTGVDEQGKGIWQWIKNTVNKDWSEGAQNFKKQIKNATDSVLTTLDPGMEEYLKPVINIGVASQNLSVLFGVKQGFSNAHGIAIVKGQHIVQDKSPLLPVGFEAGINAVNDMLHTLSNVNFEFPSEYLLLATHVFITELIPNQWSAMVCVGLKDPQRNFLLHTFSQPIPLPTECVTIAYNRTLQNVAEQFVGYDITIDEAVKLHIPFTNEKDWCSALTDIPLKHIISVVSQCLASDYKRYIASIEPTPATHQNYAVTYDNNYQQPQVTVPPMASQQPPNAVVFNGFG